MAPQSTIMTDLMKRFKTSLSKMPLLQNGIVSERVYSGREKTGKPGLEEITKLRGHHEQIDHKTKGTVCRSVAESDVEFKCVFPVHV